MPALPPLTLNTTFVLRLCRTLAELPPGKRASHKVLLPALRDGRNMAHYWMGPLVKAGIVQGIGGRSGGFFLARPANTIRLSEVFRAFTEEDTCECPLGGLCADKTPCVLHDRWAPHTQALSAVLEETTLADLIRKP